MKKFCFVAVAVLMLIATCGFKFSGDIISWGLVHNSRGETPMAPKGSTELLKKYGGKYINDADADVDKKNVYFTFDLGYESGFTGEVLDILKGYNIKATFFLCGNYLQEDELIGRMISEGHTIGNHTDRHKDLPKLDSEAMKKDIADFNEKFKEKYGEAYKKEITLFRPPKGRFNESVLEEVQNQGMKAIMWSNAIVDWGKAPIPAKLSANKIASRIHPGAIILFHIANAGMPKMLKLLIPQLAENGYAIADTVML